MKKPEIEIPINDVRMLRARTILDEFTVAMDALGVSPDFPHIIESVLECKGKIITTGMGKAGIVMRKFASTLCSFGFASCYLHPGEASHGDLGVISKDDILFVASTSGKTREVLEVIDLVNKIPVGKIIGITSHLDSPIRNRANLVMDMGQIIEAGHLRLAPTTSILVMMALTDCLALVAAWEKGITKQDYAKYHHGGYLGAAARGDRDLRTKENKK